MVEESIVFLGIINVVIYWILIEIVIFLVIGIWFEFSIIILFVVEKIVVIEEGFEKVEISGEVILLIVVFFELWEEY